MAQLLSKSVLHMRLPDSKVHGANMGPIWGWQDPGGLRVGPMNLAIWGVFILESLSSWRWDLVTNGKGFRLLGDIICSWKNGNKGFTNGWQWSTQGQQWELWYRFYLSCLSIYVHALYPRVSGSRSPNDSNSNRQEWINISTKPNSPAYPWKGILHGKSVIDHRTWSIIGHSTMMSYYNMLLQNWFVTFLDNFYITCHWVSAQNM